MSWKKELDVERITTAIAQAERQTSGEVVVAISHYFWGSVDKAAARAFDRLGIARTRQRNGVLFFVVPRRHQLVLLGDEGIHQVVGQPFWEAVVGATTKHFAQGAYTEGLVSGITQVGLVLATYFPFDPQLDQNELPNVVRRVGRYRTRNA